MLIDRSYFISGPRHILNVALGDNTPFNTNASEVNADVDAFISQYQEEFLTKALGQELGNKAHCYLVCKDEGDKVDVEEYDDVLKKLKEPFADYVFFHILREINVRATMTGSVTIKSANSVVASDYKQMTAWNRMADRMRVFSEQYCHVDPELITKLNPFDI